MAWRQFSIAIKSIEGIKYWTADLIMQYDVNLWRLTCKMLLTLPVQNHQLNQLSVLTIEQSKQGKAGIPFNPPPTYCKITDTF